MGESYDDAISRRAGNGPTTLAARPATQRPVERSGLPGSALLMLRRDNPDFVSEFLRDFSKKNEAGRIDAIIVCDENSWKTNEVCHVNAFEQ
jgi:hypothetical protein